MVRRDGAVKLMDFGIARSLETRLTQEGAVLGTPAYMAPEQAEGKPLDARSDIFSLGAVLYEMLTLRRPFPGETREEIVAGILTKEPRSARRWNSKIPLDLETICLKCIDPDPHRRYARASLLADDLQAYLDGREISARRPSVGERFLRWCRRHPTQALLYVSLVALVVRCSLRAKLVSFSNRFAMVRP